MAADQLAAGPLSTTQALRRGFVIAPALRRGLEFTIVLAFIGTALQLVVPVVLQQIIDHEILGGNSVDTGAVAQRAVAALAAMTFAGLARWQSLKRLVFASATGLAELRVKTFGHLHRLSIMELQSERRGVLVARVTADIETMQQFMEWGGMGIILGVAQIVLAMLVMTIYRWQLAIAVLLGVVIYTLLLLMFQKILARAHDRVRERVGDALSATGEAISGLSTVRAYGIESTMMHKVDSTLDDQFRAEVRTAILASSMFSSAEMFAGVLTAVVVGLGVVFGGGWGMSAGTLVAYLFLVNLLIEPVQRLVESIDQAQSAAAGLRKILGVLDTEIAIAEPANPQTLPASGIGLSFHSVTFNYPGGPDILTDVTVGILPGQRVAVVGETGSGKTTFAKLATRLLVPREGVVRIGDIPVDQIGLVSLRSRVAYVPQEGFLFDGTVADNIRYGRPGVADHVVRSAFQDLGLLDWLDALPLGALTEVGERGSNLSAGERQLVAIVRAWIADPAVLVLDEATSAVDPALEVRIRSAIEYLTSGRTSVTIAHRLSTAEASDRVIVFDEGAIVEDGNHPDLLALGGVYSAMHADWEVSTTAE
ncbi:MAG: ABC transporter ATP-binding protein [Actinomycetota bacterium]|nr:ABC transporter ATP-binding protein [Actinomycetota bacterium]